MHSSSRSGSFQIKQVNFSLPPPKNNLYGTVTTTRPNFSCLQGHRLYLKVNKYTVLCNICLGHGQILQSFSFHRITLTIKPNSACSDTAEKLLEMLTISYVFLVPKLNVDLISCHMHVSLNIIKKYNP